MVPVIRIGEDTYEMLKKWAVPLEDRPDDVIRRILDVAERFGNDSVSATSVAGRILAQSAREEGTEETADGPAEEESPRVGERVTPVVPDAQDNEPLDTDRIKRSTMQGRANEQIEFSFPSLSGLHRKARGRTARDMYLRRVGHEGSPRRGMFVQVSGDQWRLVEYATLSKSTGKWWFGASYTEIVARLRESSLENVVFLCGEEDGSVVAATLSAGRLERILHRLSKSKEGQIKFNLRRRVDGRFEITIGDAEGPEILG